MELSVDRRRILLWVTAGLVVFLIPGLVHHMHRYQQMEAMLASQERANKWVHTDTSASFEKKMVIAHKERDLDRPKEPKKPKIMMVKAHQGVPLKIPETAIVVVQKKPPIVKPQRPEKPKIQMAPVVKLAPSSVRKPKATIRKALYKPSLPNIEQELGRLKAKTPHKAPVVKAADAKPPVLLQVGVFSNTASINRLLKEIRGWGYKAYVTPLKKDGALKRVLVTLENDKRASALKDKLWKYEKVRASILG